MQTAGARIAERLRALAREPGRIVAFAGPGNNGGDAFAAFALLAREYECVVYASPARTSVAGPRRCRGTRSHVPASRFARCLRTTRKPATRSRTRSSPSTRCSEPARACRFRMSIAARRGRSTRASVACSPSIFHPESMPQREPSTRTRFARAKRSRSAPLKPGLLLDPARENCGALWLAEIGIPDTILALQPRTFAALDDREFLALLPQRGAESDKRASGAPLVIAGSPQFPGAAVLCARAAARAGAGYVTVATPEGAANAAARASGRASGGRDSRRRHRRRSDRRPARHLKTQRIGSDRAGLGLDDRTGEIVRGFLARSELPAVVDASALFHLAKHLEPLRGKRVVLTPHAGEFARLSGLGTIREGERVARLREFVERTGITTLLKGRSTLIFDGVTMHVNVTGTQRARDGRERRRFDGDHGDAAFAGPGSGRRRYGRSLLARSGRAIGTARASHRRRGRRRNRESGPGSSDPSGDGSASPHLLGTRPFQSSFIDVSYQGTMSVQKSSPLSIFAVAVAALALAAGCSGQPHGSEAIPGTLAMRAPAAATNTISVTIQTLLPPGHAPHVVALGLELDGVRKSLVPINIGSTSCTKQHGGRIQLQSDVQNRARRALADGRRIQVAA